MESKNLKILSWIRNHGIKICSSFNPLQYDILGKKLFYEFTSDFIVYFDKEYVTTCRCPNSHTTLNNFMH